MFNLKSALNHILKFNQHWIHKYLLASEAPLWICLSSLTHLVTHGCNRFLFCSLTQLNSFAQKFIKIPHIFCNHTAFKTQILFFILHNINGYFSVGLFHCPIVYLFNVCVSICLYPYLPIVSLQWGQFALVSMYTNLK